MSKSENEVASNRRKGCFLLAIFVCVAVAIGLVGCEPQEGDDSPSVSTNDGRFEVFWPPRDLGRISGKSDTPLLGGELALFESADGPASGFKIHLTLRRAEGEQDRVRWNKNLAFPEYSWMSKVRVWDRDGMWLWPNLPYLLRAHGEERVDRYGGIDPGKGIDNDFAAVLIRSLAPIDSPAESGISELLPPLVSAEWVSVEEGAMDRESIVHVARSDEFSFRVVPTPGEVCSGQLGVWLIYADFLGADVPRNWPSQKEYAGGILAYFQVDWLRRGDGDFEFEVLHLVPPTDTGFDWAGWSTGDSALERNLKMTLPVDH